MTNRLRDQIIRDEGSIAFAYDDATGRAVVRGYTMRGYVTIGVGFMVDRDKGGGLRQEEIVFILDNRLRILSEELKARLPFLVKLSETRQAVLVNMAFQMGVSGLLGFKNTLAMIERGDYSGAAKGMLNSR